MFSIFNNFGMFDISSMFWRFTTCWVFLFILSTPHFSYYHDGFLLIYRSVWFSFRFPTSTPWAWVSSLLHEGLMIPEAGRRHSSAHSFNRIRIYSPFAFGIESRKFAKLPTFRRRPSGFFMVVTNFPYPLFLDAFSHLYKRVCPSVRPSVRPSVCRSVRHTRVEFPRNGPNSNKIDPGMRKYTIWKTIQRQVSGQLARTHLLSELCSTCYRHFSLYFRLHQLPSPWILKRISFSLTQNIHRV